MQLAAWHHPVPLDASWTAQPEQYGEEVYPRREERPGGLIVSFRFAIALPPAAIAAVVDHSGTAAHFTRVLA